MAVSVMHVTIVLNSEIPSQWMVTTLEALLQNESIELTGIIIDSSHAFVAPAKKQPSNPLRRLAEHILHSAIDKPRFKSDPCKPQALPDHLIRLKVDKTSKQQTDLVLHLGEVVADSSSERHGISLSPTLGTWVIKHKDLSAHIEKALLMRAPLLWLHLWEQSDQPAASAIRISSHALPMQSFSITDINNYTFGSLPAFIVSRINWLAHGLDPAAYEAAQLSTELYPPNTFALTSESLASESQELSTTTFLTRTLALLFLQTRQRVRDRLQLEQWQLAYHVRRQQHAPEDHATDTSAPSARESSHATDVKVSHYQELLPPANTIWSDPHCIEDQGLTHVFFEEMELSEKKGRIVTAVLTDNGFKAAPVTVLDEAHHLSYPFVFKHEDTFYMVPETASRRTISLYKAAKFPSEWQFVENLIEDINAADSTLIFHNGLWWMFTNSVTHPSVDERDELLIFYSSSLLSGDWTPHPLNPVVTGVDRARMAGPLYHRQGHLYRPSQYGANRYGYGINVSEISSLTTSDYQERLLSRLTPTDAWLGCHTTAHTGSLTVIDRVRRVSKKNNATKDDSM